MEAKTVRCRMCKRMLTSAGAKQAGIGPVCFRKITGKALPRVKSPDDAARRSKAHKRHGLRILANQVTIYELLQEEADVTDNQQAAC